MITTVAAVVFITLALAVVMGLLDNPYAGLVVFVARSRALRPRPAADPAGDVAASSASCGAHPEAVADWSVMDFRKPRVRRITLAVIALSAVNLVILLLAGYGTLHWMESPSFCGQACHEPMHPQFTAWQANEHSGVRCTDCHIGEGARAFLHYKLVGVRQLYHVITRPDSAADSRRRRSAPGAGSLRQLPLAAIAISAIASASFASTPTTSRTRRRRRSCRCSRADLASRRRAAGRFTGTPTRGSPSTYVATDKDRQTIPWVQVTDAQGQVREYVTEGTTPEQLAQGERRTMDCVTCHNVVAHRISPTAERAVDEAIAAGEISRKLPFVRREGVRLLKADTAIRTRASGDRRRAAEVLRAEGRRDSRRRSRPGGDHAAGPVPPQRVPGHEGHLGRVPGQPRPHDVVGCFRCHDGGHVAKDGAKISDDCEYCHRQVDVPPVTPTAPVPPK